MQINNRLDRSNLTDEELIIISRLLDFAMDLCNQESIELINTPEHKKIMEQAHNWIDPNDPFIKNNSKFIKTEYEFLMSYFASRCHAIVMQKNQTKQG